MSFIDFARAHGVEINPDRLFASERIRRCGTVDKPRSTNGAYFWDGQRGWVFNWSEGARVEWYQNPNAKPWTDADKDAWRRQRQYEAQRRQSEQQKAVERAMELLKHAERRSHSYLEMKGLPDEMGLVLEDRLMVPMRNVITNDLQGVQTIWWDDRERKYHKKMIFGMRAKDAVMWMGPRNQGAWLVEGYATGLSLLKALRSIGHQDAVVVCFSANNMKSVAEKLQGSVKIFADNDESGVGEATAKETGKPYVMADEKGWDANDLHHRNGLFAVVAKIMEI